MASYFDEKLLAGLSCLSTLYARRLHFHKYCPKSKLKGVIIKLAMSYIFSRQETSLKSNLFIEHERLYMLMRNSMIVWFVQNKQYSLSALGVDPRRRHPLVHDLQGVPGLHHLGEGLVVALVDDDEIEVVDERSLRKQGTMSAEMQLKPLEGDFLTIYIRRHLNCLTFSTILGSWLCHLVAKWD